MEQKPGQQQKKKEDNNIQAMEMRFLRVVLNKTEKDRIRNTKFKLELGMDEI